MQHGSLHLAAFVAALGLTEIAWTAEPEKPQVPPPEKLSHGGTDDASTLYAQAQELYAKGDLDGSLQKLRQCYDQTRAVNLLFNLAQLYRELSNCTAALAHYQRYVQQASKGERVPDAKRHIDELTKQCAVEEPQQTPAVTRPGTANAAENRLEPASAKPIADTQAPITTAEPLRSPALDRPMYWPTLGWCALGAGVVLGSASAYFVANAIEARKDTETTGDGKEYNHRASELSRDTALAVTFGIASAATIGFSAYALLYAAPKERQQTSAAAAWTLGWSPAGPAFTYRGRF